MPKHNYQRTQAPLLKFVKNADLTKLRPNLLLLLLLFTFLFKNSDAVSQHDLDSIIISQHPGTSDDGFRGGI